MAIKYSPGGIHCEGISYKPGLQSYSEFRRTSNSVSRSVSRSGLRDGKFMVGKVQCFYIVTYGKNKS